MAYEEFSGELDKPTQFEEFSGSLDKPQEERGIIQRIKDVIAPEYKSVLETQQPTLEQQQTERAQRLSYGAGPVSQETVAKADLARSGLGKVSNQQEQIVAKEMQRRGEKSFGELTSAAKQKEEQPTLVSDVGNLAGMGINAMAQDVREIVGSIPLVGKSVVDKLDSIDSWASGKSSDQLLKENTKAGQAKLTEEMRSAGEKKWWDSKKGSFGDAWSDPRSYISGLVQSLPEQALTMVPSMALAKGIYAAKIAAGVAPQAAAIASSRAATIAGGVSEGLLGGAQSSRNVRDNILSMTPDQLKESDAVNAMMSQGISFEKAREKLANDSASQAFVLAGITTGIFGGMGDRMMAKAITEGLGNSVASRTIKGIVGEGLLEEFPQSYTQAVSENIAMRGATPQVGITEGALNQALGGLAVGALQGGGMAAGFGHNASQPAPAPEVSLAEQMAKERGFLTPERAPAPAPTVQQTNFTPADSPTKAAGLVDVVVPLPSAPVELPPISTTTEQQFGLDKLRMGTTDVGMAGTPGATNVAGGTVGSTQPGGGVGNTGLGAPAAGGQPSPLGAQGAATGNGKAAPVGGVTGQQVAPIETWGGRRNSEGYLTEKAANDGLESRKQKFPDLTWSVEQMPNGRYRLAGYPSTQQETTLGTQTTQAQQAKAQGQQAPVATPAVTPETVAGEKLNKEWTAFAPETGTKGIPRAEMPQIKSENRGAMVNFLNARGITSTQEEVPANSLKPTQAEFSPEKVASALEYTYGDRSILVSSDNHVLDGHHQWLAKLQSGEPVKVIRLNAPIDELINVVREFPSATVAAGATNTGLAQGQVTPVAGAEGTGVAGAPQLGTGQEGFIPAQWHPSKLQVPGSTLPTVTTGIAGQTEKPTLELKPVKGAPIFAIKLAQDDIMRNEGVGTETVKNSDLNEQQKATIQIAHLYGKTFTYLNQVSGPSGVMPNGLIVNRSHIFLDAKSEDGPLFVGMHEVTHGLPDHIRKPLLKALRSLFKTGMEGKLKVEFKYSDKELDEEIPALMIQAISKRPQFWQDLRKEMGNKDFAALADLILDRLSKWVKGIKDAYGQGFLDKYVTDVEAAQKLLVEAHAQAMREVEQSTSENGGVQQSNRAQEKAGFVISDYSGNVFKPQTPAEIRSGFANRLLNPVTLADGSRLSGFTDPAKQTTFHGYDKNGQAFTVRREYVNPSDIVSSKDSNRTSEKIKAGLQSLGEYKKFSAPVTKDTSEVGGIVESKKINDSQEQSKQDKLKSQIDRSNRQVDQTKTEEFKLFSHDAPLVTSSIAGSYNFKTGEKVVLEAFHGTKRPDRVGTKFLKKRATSGPMAFFTSAPDLASSYATNKSDTSVASDEYTDYANWFKVKFKGDRTATDIVRAWNFLTLEQRSKIANMAPKISLDPEGSGSIVVDEENTRGNGSYDHELSRTRSPYNKLGNPLRAMTEDWLSSGNLFNEEGRFMEVLKLAGFPMENVEFDDPHAEYPFVYKTYIAMQKPLVTGDIPNDVIEALKDAAKKDRSKPQKFGADMWDKKTRTLREWVGQFTDESNKDAAYLWTSIPDKVTDVFRSMGYDGIIDYSGKGGSHMHPVYIPFEETQVKSAIGNKGKFDVTKNDIMRSNRQTETPAFKRWFGDSKVVDAEGKPLVVYRADRASFDIFDKRKSKDGFFFHTSAEVAKSYGGTARAFYLNIQNPLVTPDALPNERNADDIKGTEFDGLINERSDGLEFIAIRPNQIKSATENNGEFDPENPSIVRSNRGQAKLDEVAQLFGELHNARGLAKVRAKANVAEHKLADNITKVEDQFYDILQKLDDDGLIKINCK